MNKREKRQLKKASRAKARGLRAKTRLVMSNFRLSLTFRIALHYCWQLFRTTIIALLILSIGLGCAVLFSMEDDIRRIRMGDASPGEAVSQEIIMDHDTTAALTDEIYQGDMLYRVVNVRLEGTSPLLLIEASHHTGFMLRISMSLRDESRILLAVWVAALLADLMRMVIFLRRRERLNKTVLSPIHDITEMATTLSANNLSNRINIAGTKNELKDLAVVINSMLDRIERSYNSQKQFVSDASHELRTPIAVIQGYISMLQRWGKSDPEILDEGITAIAQETASMKELVESLLFLARHDKKTLMMEMARFDARDLVTELHREASMVTPEDRFLLNAPEACPMEGDRGMIKQVMRILCDNAVKYTPKGGTITLGISATEDWCTLSVADNGPGIPADEIPKIFDRFYRSDTARKSEGGGHGLGLSIARIIVMAHGGKLRVRSKVGSGSTFFIVLPRKQDKLHTADLSGGKEKTAAEA